MPGAAALLESAGLRVTARCRGGDPLLTIAYLLGFGVDDLPTDYVKDHLMICDPRPTPIAHGHHLPSPSDWLYMGVGVTARRPCEGEVTGSRD